MLDRAEMEHRTFNPSHHRQVVFHPCGYNTIKLFIRINFSSTSEEPTSRPNAHSLTIKINFVYGTLTMQRTIRRPKPEDEWAHFDVPMPVGGALTSGE